MGNRNTPAAMDGSRLAAESWTTNRRGLGVSISPQSLQLLGMELRAPNQDSYPTGHMFQSFTGKIDRTKVIPNPKI
ncbi:MAG: hypothetical protein WA118_09160 [Carboxydocellales bacterium]